MDLDPSILWDFAGEIAGTIRQRPRSVPATVTRIDRDGTVWAATADGDEAPVASSSVGVRVGDEVRVEWSGTQMGIVGNASDPPEGRDAVGKLVSSVQRVAESAKAIAEATGQFFWADDSGAHVSTEKGNPAGPQNTVWNSLGMLFRKGKNVVLAIVTGADPGMDVYDGQGNADANIMASFRRSGIKLLSMDANDYETQVEIGGSEISMSIDDSPGNPKKVLSLALSGSRIGTKLTVLNPNDPSATGSSKYLTLGEPSLITSTFEETNVANATNKSIGSVRLGAGVWVVVALVRFHADASGIRRVGLSDSSNTMPTTGPVLSMNAVLTGSTRVFLTWVVDNGRASAGAPFVSPPLYLTAYQNSGSTLACTGHIRAVHIS